MSLVEVINSLPISCDHALRACINTSQYKRDTDPTDSATRSTPLLSPKNSCASKMVRQRKLPSAGSSNAAAQKQGSDAAETHDHNDQPATKRDDSPPKPATSTGDKTHQHQELSPSESEDTRTFQQLVQDYGDDSKCASHLVLRSHLVDP